MGQSSADRSADKAEANIQKAGEADQTVPIAVFGGTEKRRREMSGRSMMSKQHGKASHDVY
jgi:hypothetical protein